MLLDNFKRNPQSSGYPFAARLLGIPVVGTVIETILVPNPGKTARANPKYDTMTHPIPVPQHYLDEFALWAYSTGAEILHRFKTKNCPKDMSACATYSQFGEPGYPCRYMNLCEILDWSVLKNMYRIEKYDPFEVDHVKLEQLTRAAGERSPEPFESDVLPKCIFE